MTTRPFEKTTFTNASPSTLSSYPTTYTDTAWLPRTTADTRCASATGYYPNIAQPRGTKAACVISNAAEINPNAFWDMYECCPGRDMSAFGYPFEGGDAANAPICMMQCSVGEDDDVNWHQVGRCLQERVKEVICVPRVEQTGSKSVGLGNSTITSTSTNATRSVQVTARVTTSQRETSRAVEGTGQSVSAAGSTGAAALVDVAHASSSKLGLFTFFVLAVGSAAGMFL